MICYFEIRMIRLRLLKKNPCTTQFRLKAKLLYKTVFFSITRTKCLLTNLPKIMLSETSFAWLRSQGGIFGIWKPRVIACTLQQLDTSRTQFPLNLTYAWFGVIIIARALHSASLGLSRDYFHNSHSLYYIVS